MCRALFFGLPLACLLAACSYDNGNATRIHDEYPGGGSGQDCGPATPVQTWIDVDAQIETEPGQGAGVFVEYATGGHWVVRTTCDTAKNNTPCPWDIIVTPEDNRTISNVLPEDLEAGTDSIGVYPDYPRSYQLIAQTSGDLDGFTFDTEPQTAISVDVLLDETCALPYLFWVEDGVVVQTGAPSNPLVLVPKPE